jgi:hypothetical protein
VSLSEIDESTVLGSILAGLLILISLYFGSQQIRERKSAGQSASEDRYLATRRLRRLAGSLVMIMIAAGMIVGLWTDPRAGRLERQLWGWSWIIAIVLLGFLLALGLWDWFALRGFARRAGRALAAERRALIAREARERRARGVQPPGLNGHRQGDPPGAV